MGAGEIHWKSPPLHLIKIYQMRPLLAFFDLATRGASYQTVAITGNIATSSQMYFFNAKQGRSNVIVIYRARFWIIQA